MDAYTSRVSRRRLRDYGPDEDTPLKLFGSSVSLYRVLKQNAHTPVRNVTSGDHPVYSKSASAQTKSEIVAGAYKNVKSPSDIPDTLPPRPIPEDLLEELTRHLDWKNRSPTKFISTTLSFPWAVWEMNRIQSRAAACCPRLELAVIDGAKLFERAQTAVYLLKPKECSTEWDSATDQEDCNIRYAKSAQEVLVFGRVPASAIIKVVEYCELSRYLPSWLPGINESLPKPLELPVGDHPSFRAAVQHSRKIRKHISDDEAQAQAWELASFLLVLSEKDRFEHLVWILLV